jgi:hypothetical protein
MCRRRALVQGGETAGRAPSQPRHHRSWSGILICLCTLKSLSASVPPPSRTRPHLCQNLVLKLEWGVLPRRRVLVESRRVLTSSPHRHRDRPERPGRGRWPAGPNFPDKFFGQRTHAPDRQSVAEIPVVWPSRFNLIIRARGAPHKSQVPSETTERAPACHM